MAIIEATISDLKHSPRDVLGPAAKGDVIVLYTDDAVKRKNWGILRLIGPGEAVPTSVVPVSVSGLKTMTLSGIGAEDAENQSPVLSVINNYSPGRDPFDGIEPGAPAFVIERYNENHPALQVSAEAPVPAVFRTAVAAASASIEDVRAALEAARTSLSLSMRQVITVAEAHLQADGAAEVTREAVIGFLTTDRDGSGGIDRQETEIPGYRRISQYVRRKIG